MSFIELHTFQETKVSIKKNINVRVKNSQIRKELFKTIPKIIEKIGLKPKGYIHLHHINPVRNFNMDSFEESFECYKKENLVWINGSENISISSKGRIPANKKIKI